MADLTTVLGPLKLPNPVLVASAPSGTAKNMVHTLILISWVDWWSKALPFIPEGATGRPG